MQLACSFVFRRYILEAREILTRFKRNEITLEEAEHYFRKEPFEKMADYAKLD